MRFHRLTVPTLVALLAACIGYVPARSTTRLTSAETPEQNPALIKVDPAEVETKRAGLERESAFGAILTRIGAADAALDRMKSRLERATADERSELDARIARAEIARSKVELQLRSARGPGGWPAQRGEVDAAVTAFERAVVDPPR